MSARIEVAAAGPAHREGLRRLFEACSSPCYCRFWHFEGTNNEWLNRCANAPEENRSEFESALESGDPEARGVVAFLASGDEHGNGHGRGHERGHEHGYGHGYGRGHEYGNGHGYGQEQGNEHGHTNEPTLIGWLKVAPATVMKKLYDRRLYRGLPCFQGDREGVFVIGCALIHPAHRHQGVATALVEGAVRIAPSWGARSLEAFPRRPKEPVSDEELFTGPITAFTKNGFIEVNDFEPYPVLRRTL